MSPDTSMRNASWEVEKARRQLQKAKDESNRHLLERRHRSCPCQRGRAEGFQKEHLHKACRPLTPAVGRGFSLLNGQRMETELPGEHRHKTTTGPQPATVDSLGAITQEAKKKKME